MARAGAAIRDSAGRSAAYHRASHGGHVRTKVLSDLIDGLPAEVLPYALRVARSSNVRAAGRSPVADHGDQSGLEAVAALAADQPYRAAQILADLAPRLPKHSPTELKRSR